MLPTCFSYNVQDENHTVILQLKLYDKIMDLVGRDGIQKVGSRMNKVLGSVRGQDQFIKRVLAAETTGLTRVEISMCSGAFKKYNPFQPSVKTKWHEKMENFMRKLESKVLNNEETLVQTYRRLDVTHLVARLACLKETLMIIGNSHSWIVNAVGVHR